jgi:predicted phage baseplate assembly protein
MHEPNILYLDNDYNLQSNGWIVIEKPGIDPIYVKLRQENISARSLAAYSLAGKTTRIDLPLTNPWIQAAPNEPFSTVRNTIVYAQSEKLDLVEEPIEEKIEGKEIELNGFYDGLEPGRWAIISGEREDVPQVKFSELVMIAAVEQTISNLPGDKPHTKILLSTELAYSYKRNTVTIYGNVVKATQGETRAEVLGSGDGSKAFQEFTLRQPPLTYLAAPTPAGAESTLKVRVNDVLWYETDTLTGLESSDRKYVTHTDEEQKTTVIFGNGQNGSRLPSGMENVRAVYRSGIGKAGNVKAEQISQLATRPLGVKGVINPLPATGGADRESQELARRNAPLGVMSLDRLVSVQDYADFARTFAGIGKASAMKLTDGRRQVVHVTIAGADDIPIDANSDLYRNLRQALHQFGDPFQPMQLAVRELMVLIIVAKVRILSDYLWESVEAKIRSALLDIFSFEHRELGQSVFLGEAIATMQKVPGVAYVDVDILNSVSESEVVKPEELIAKLAKPLSQQQPKPENYIRVNLARINPKATDFEKRIQPAQLAILSPEIADTLILQQL